MKISIIVPAFNEERLLARSLEPINQISRARNTGAAQPDGLPCLV
jgi:hypothetical protein